MNSTRRGLLVSNLDRPVKSKTKQASRASRARKPVPEAHSGRAKPVSDKALATKSEKSRQSVLEAAARLFRQQGYSATTLRQIASMAEIKAGSIYYYFDSKEAILDEVLDQGLHRIFEAVKTALKKAGKISHRRRIGLAIETHLVALLEASDFTSANIRIYGQLPERLKNRHRSLRRAYAKYWDQLFLDARRAGEIRADIEIVPLRIFVLGSLNWTVEWFSYSKKESVQKLAQRTEMLILDGVTRK
jgi:TetR/AcrR family transcriptional regulator, cholesterol catabolism regulator